MQQQFVRAVSKTYLGELEGLEPRAIQFYSILIHGICSVTYLGRQCLRTQFCEQQILIGSV